MINLPDPQVINSMFQLLEKTLQDLYRIIGFESNQDNPKEMMEATKIFVIEVILRLNKKVETLRPGYGDILLDSISKVSQRDSEARKFIENPTPEGFLEKSESGISPDDMPTAIYFLANKIIDQLEIDFVKLPILLRNETTMLCSLGEIVSNIFKKFEHKDSDAFVNNFSEILRVFITAKQDDVPKQIDVENCLHNVKE